MRFGTFLQQGVLRDPDPAPGSGGPPAVPDFKALIADAIRGAIPTIVEQVRTAVVPPPAPAPAPVPTPAPTPAPAPAPTPGTEDMTPSMRSFIANQERQQNALRAEVERLTNESKADRERADEASRRATVATAMSGFDFVNTRAQNDYAASVAARAEKAADGTWVIGGLPVADAVRAELEGEAGYQLKPRGLPGTGVDPGGPGRGAPSVTDLIKRMKSGEKLTPELEKQVSAHLSNWMHS